MAGVPYGTAKEALLQAAVTIAATRGLRGLTYRSVAAAAGVTHGSVRYHFGSWDALVEEALLHCVGPSIDDIHLRSPASASASWPRASSRWSPGTPRSRRSSSSSTWRAAAGRRSPRSWSG
ncbi:TetR/AcrR family transcriptional regulator [Klenkia terrae]|uniref:TetR/AcrR family transcriptional regulator n=1 Tax=Klenkia terrae TaxID=1052259 RepID=UPI003617510C